jgi:hypothetical protein
MWIETVSNARAANLNEGSRALTIAMRPHAKGLRWRRERIKKHAD